MIKYKWNGKKLGEDRTRSLSTNLCGCLLQCLEKGCLCVTLTKDLSRSQLLSYEAITCFFPNDCWCCLAHHLYSTFNCLSVARILGQLKRGKNETSNFIIGESHSQWRLRKFDSFPVKELCVVICFEVDLGDDKFSNWSWFDRHFFFKAQRKKSEWIYLFFLWLFGLFSLLFSNSCLSLLLFLALRPKWFPSSSPRHVKFPKSSWPLCHKLKRHHPWAWIKEHFLDGHRNHSSAWSFGRWPAPPVQVSLKTESSSWDFLGHLCCLGYTWLWTNWAYSTKRQCGQVVSRLCKDSVLMHRDGWSDSWEWPSRQDRIAQFHDPQDHHRNVLLWFPRGKLHHFPLVELFLQLLP